MIIKRLFARVPRVDFMSIDQHLTQLGWYRRLCGGIFVKMGGQWHGAVALLVLSDGTRVLRCENTTTSFHETFNGIQQLEEHA